MKKTFVSPVAVLLLSVVAMQSAFAAVSEPEPPAAPAAQCDLTFATGPKAKGYSVFHGNYKDVCPQVPTCEMNSEGGLENAGLLIEKKADIAIMGVNILKTLLDKDDAYKSLQVVASLHSNLLHVATLSAGIEVPGPMVPGPQVANPKYQKYNVLSKEPEMIAGPQVAGPSTRIQIGKFSDLKGRVVGVVGSAQLLARQLDKMAGHGMDFIDFDNDAAAIAAMKAGKVQGVMTMAAWPHGYLKGLKQDFGVKLVTYDLAPVPPFAVVKKGYKNLGQYSLEFLAEPNILVTRAFTPGGQNAKNVAAVKSCIAAKLSALKDGKYEPAWSEVVDMNQTFGLPAFTGASMPATKK